MQLLIFLGICTILFLECKSSIPAAWQSLNSPIGRKIVFSEFSLLTMICSLGQIWNGRKMECTSTSLTFPSGNWRIRIVNQSAESPSLLTFVSLFLAVKTLLQRWPISAKRHHSPVSTIQICGWHLGNQPKLVKLKSASTTMARLTASLAISFPTTLLSDPIDTLLLAIFFLPSTSVFILLSSSGWVHCYQLGSCFLCLLSSGNLSVARSGSLHSTTNYYLLRLAKVLLLLNKKFKERAYQEPKQKPLVLRWRFLLRIQILLDKEPFCVHLSYPLLAWLIWFAFLPWSLGYVIGDVIGVIFSFGIFYRGELHTRHEMYAEGFWSMISFVIPYLFYTSYFAERKWAEKTVNPFKSVFNLLFFLLIPERVLNFEHIYVNSHFWKQI